MRRTTFAFIVTTFVRLCLLINFHNLRYTVVTHWYKIQAYLQNTWYAYDSSSEPVTDEEDELQLQSNLYLLSTRVEVNKIKAYSLKTIPRNRPFHIIPKSILHYRVNINNPTISNLPQGIQPQQRTYLHQRQHRKPQRFLTSSHISMRTHARMRFACFSELRKIDWNHYGLLVWSIFTASFFIVHVVKSQPTSDAAFFVLKPFLRIIHFRNASVSWPQINYIFLKVVIPWNMGL